MSTNANGGRTITVVIQNNSSSALVLGSYQIIGQGSWKPPAPALGDLINEETSKQYTEVTSVYIGDCGGTMSFVALKGGGFNLSWDWNVPNPPTTTTQNNAGSKVTATSSLSNVGSTSITVLCQVTDAS